MESIQIKIIREKVKPEHFDSLPDISLLSEEEKQGTVEIINNLKEGFISFKYNGKNYIAVNQIISSDNNYSTENCFYDFDNNMERCANPMNQQMNTQQ